MKRTGKDRVGEAIVTFLGLGKLPIAPGTWGTLGAALVHAIVATRIGTAAHPYVLPVLAAVFTVASLVSCPWAERFYGRKDPSPFVIDEVAGYFLVVSFFPHHRQLPVSILAFFLFRVFDVIKPPPARRLEALPAGLGIVLDDLVAGLYAALCTGVILWVF
ncbi:MAG: phosphatidylglycerophosphatase A [Planctomycetota bacterium]